MNSNTHSVFSRLTFSVGAGGVGVAGLACWAYWPTLVELAAKWTGDPQYSHGYLVPAFAAVLLWMRRDMLRTELLRPSWCGLALLLVSLGLRAGAGYYYFNWFDAVSVLPCLAGVCLAFGGWHALKWSWPAIAFLIFMVPLPYRLEMALGQPLQHIATVTSTYALQTLGLPALSEGNTILLNDVTLGIAEACSGLRMLVVFFALSTATAMVIERPLWEKLLVVFSAIPIALLTNMVRITTTGLAYVYLSSEAGHAIFHDLAGWFMMPIALAMLWVEFRLLARLLVVEDPDQVEAVPILVGVGPTRRS